jgi:hypothetical protein
MKPEDSLLHSQEPTAGPYPGTDESSPQVPTTIEKALLNKSKMNHSKLLRYNKNSPFLAVNTPKTRIHILIYSFIKTYMDITACNLLY